MSDVNSLEELIEWLKSENFDHPTTFEKLKGTYIYIYIYIYNNYYNYIM